MTTLRLAENLTLPIAAVTETFAILGIRGSGKTNTGVVLAEELLKQAQQVVVLDPTDAWYGIRSSQDGRSEGFKVIIMGGDHGDLPLEGTSGKICAEFIVETGASVVFSLRHLSISDQRRFAQDFAERLYDLKGKSGNRSPLHIFVDEADEFIPQRIPHGFERMFGAYDRLVRRGRSSGIGLTMISQRPQVINKDTLSQVEVLVCMRLLHKLDRKAVKEGWVEGHDTEGKAEEFMGSLASLDRGTAWVWSPSWLNVFKLCDIRVRETFDSSYTPKAGEKPKQAAMLAAVDLNELRKRMAATIEKAKAEDPRELKKQIAELRRQLLARVPVGIPRQLVTTADPKAIARAVKEVELRTAKAIKDRDAAIRALKGTLSSIAQESAHAAGVSITEWRPVKTTTEYRAPAVAVKTLDKATAQGNGEVKLREGARRMIAALCMWHPEAMTVGQMRSHAGLKKSGTFSAYMSDLRREGLIEENGNNIKASQRAVDVFGKDHDAPSSTEEVMAIWMPKLREGARRMLQVLVDAKGEPISSAELQERAELAKSGTFSAYLSDLRTARLIRSDSQGIAADKDNLFL